MKILRLIPVIGIVLAFVISCQKEEDTASFLVGKKVATVEETPDHKAEECGSYVVTLESKTYVNGKWEWVWSIQNKNTAVAADLAYWAMQFGECFDVKDICSAGYRYSPGEWVSFTPLYQVDPSLKCAIGPVLKFPKGTTGTNKTYYRLVLTRDYGVIADAKGNSKSVCGCCCNLSFCGVGCPPVIGNWCSFSQGYWFARPKTTWCQGVVFGANTYSQQQGKNIWDNAPANSAVKHAFTQASTLQLSVFCKNQGAAIPGDILAAYNTCANFLSGLNYNQVLTGEYPPSDYSELNSAAGAIGDWVNSHHCD